MVEDQSSPTAIGRVACVRGTTTVARIVSVSLLGLLGRDRARRLAI